MYAADPRITHLPAAPEQVVSIFASLNKPHIAVPGKAAQEVQAFVIGVGNAAGSYTLFVYLFLTQTREAVVYVDHDNLRVDAQAYPNAEADALGFVESMGFMVEPVNFRNLAREQQAELMKSLPCFTKELGAPAPQKVQRTVERNDPPQVRLARLLAAF